MFISTIRLVVTYQSRLLAVVGCKCASITSSIVFKIIGPYTIEYVKVMTLFHIQVSPRQVTEGHHLLWSRSGVEMDSS